MTFIQRLLYKVVMNTHIYNYPYVYPKNYTISYVPTYASGSFSYDDEIKEDKIKKAKRILEYLSEEKSLNIQSVFVNHDKLIKELVEII